MLALSAENLVPAKTVINLDHLKIVFKLLCGLELGHRTKNVDTNDVPKVIVLCHLRVLE